MRVCDIIPKVLALELMAESQKQGVEFGASLDRGGRILSLARGGSHSVVLEPAPITLHTHPNTGPEPSLVDRISYLLHHEEGICVLSVPQKRGRCYWARPGDIRQRLRSLKARIDEFNRRWARGERDMEEGRALLRERASLVSEAASLPLESCELEV